MMAGNIDGYSRAVAITPSDATNFTDGACHAIYVGGAGAVVAIVNGTAITFSGAAAGSVIEIRATRVNATGTVATGLVALY